VLAAMAKAVLEAGITTVPAPGRDVGHLNQAGLVSPR
jgi:hypothetical protein